MLRAAISCLAALFILTASAKAEPPKAPVLVELFTSQGCYSCPPADALLGRLAHEGEVVALGFHVDYWDRLGWPDPYASRASTERQYGYGRTVSQGRVYTPQMVIDGAAHEVGSAERRVRAAIARAERQPRPVTPRLQWLAPGRLQITLPAATDAKGAEIWLARFDRRQETEILRGENGGKRLAYHNIVRERRSLGRYMGQGETFEARVQAGEGENWGVAVVVQTAGPGRVWGAALLGPASPDA